MFISLEFQQQNTNEKELSRVTCWLLGAIITALSIALTIALLVTDKAVPGLADLAAKNLDISGVENPVTAVLLNFRSYDTLLEIAVLLIVAVAILPTQSSTTTQFLSVDDKIIISPVLVGLLKWLVPLAILVGGYLLWTGAYSPGGAFQAGAVVAGAGVALSLAGRHDFLWQTTKARVALNLGLLVFLLVAAANAIVTGTSLQYPVEHAGWLILVVEIAATLSIAAILLLLFVRLKKIAERSEQEINQ